MFTCMIIARSNNARAPDDLSGRRGHAVAGDWKAALRGQNRKQAIAVVIGSASMAAWLSTQHQRLLLLITVLFLRTIKYVLLLQLLLACVASIWLSVTP